ncbi:MAG: HAMP domain-containing histidine kinase [Christensenellaceae bacterium]|nr:HAMP domain-containing histidine kinase [Christensenellaceae bacterium]
MHGFNRASRGLHGKLSGLLSNFRLSLTFRIAIHYCWQLMRTTLPVMLLVTLIYAGTQAVGMETSLNRVVQVMPDDGASYSQLILQDASLQAELLEREFPLKWNEQLSYVLGESLTLLPNRLCLVSRHVATGKTVLMTVSLNECWKTWGWLMTALLLCDLMRMISFIRRRQKLDKRVLAPIRDITDMAATLSASNLSNRINIAGMKNELKDLATVINTMLDRIERSYNSQKQFVSDASHELRTPIAVIQGYIRMLKRWGKDDKTVLEEAITAIDQEASGMKELVESLLFLARHDKKTLLMEMESFDPVDVVSELHREAAMVTPENTFLFTPADHCLIEADRGMMKQVMRILLDNAVKYTPKGGTITMGVRKEVNGCTLLMSDNGAGIPKEELPKIFERFYRSDSARKAESSGHGLGLSIARIIVIAHGGKLRVRSKVGVGTTFSISLPEKQPCLHAEENS